MGMVRVPLVGLARPHVLVGSLEKSRSTLLPHFAALVQLNALQNDDEKPKALFATFIRV